MQCGLPASLRTQVLHFILKWIQQFTSTRPRIYDAIYEDDDVKEAIRRLPENLCNYRVFLIKRALDLEYEEDTFYLELYLKEIIQERKGREEWAKK
ncbi:hypothetical protein AB1E18_010461 [Capra hircus]